MHRIEFAQDKGFTLVEALTTTALIAIVASIAVPTFTHMILSNKRSSATQQIRSLLAHARSSAVTQQKTVGLCASQDGHSCTRTGALHFIVFSDHNLNNAVDAGEIIRKEAAVADTRYELSASSLDSFRFRPNGTAMSYGNVVLCPSADNRYAAKLIINSMGRARSARDTNGDGLIEGPDGNPLDCPPE